MKAVEIAIESGKMFKINKATTIPQVEIDRPFIIPIKDVGAIDLKQCFLKDKKLHYSKLLKSRKHI